MKRGCADENDAADALATKATPHVKQSRRVRSYVAQSVARGCGVFRAFADAHASRARSGAILEAYRLGARTN